MRKIKRIIALVTVAMFLLSLAAPAAFAATKEESFGRLNALGVAVGDETGNPQYDKNFTRAEAAAIMVNLSGMKAAIDAAKGPTKFKDVPASHWASGVINLAVGAGIIKGYPDGTYKPDANVTYAEMSAMLVGVLGYTPKLQGTWPSNVIGKAAQLGLLDGVSVTDYNGAAVRSNVFLASDNALDTKVLKEMKDGYEEGDLLMVSKLNVTIKPEGTITDVPVTSGVKDKVSIDYTDSKYTDGTLEVNKNVDANPNLGLKVEAWVKDDKVFFFNVKTDSSNIINDKLDENLKDVDSDLKADANDTIHVDKADKNYTLDTNVKVFKNYTNITSDANTAGQIVDKDEVRLVLNSGKVAYLIANKYTTAMVEKVDTTNEKLTFEIANSLDLKDKVNTIVKNGKAIALGDIKAGNVVDYIKGASDGSRYVVVSDGVVEGKLTAASSDAKTLTIADKAVKATGTVYISTNNGDTYSATPLDSGSDYVSHFGKTVKGFLNKDGKVAFMIATEGDVANQNVVLVKDIKRSTAGAADATYIYVAKFDGTETSYEVTKDSKVNGTKVKKDLLETAGRAATLVSDNAAAETINRGDIIKLSLTADNKVDNMKQFESAEIISAGGITAGFTANKTADTIVVGASSVKIDSNTKLLKVKEYKDNDTDVVTVPTADSTINYLQDPLGDGAPVYVDDVDTLTWAGLENVGTQAAGHIGVIASNGMAKYVVLFSKNIQTASDYKYGIFVDSQALTNSTEWKMKVDNADMTKAWDNGIGESGPKKGTVIKFKLNGDGEIDSAASITTVAYDKGTANAVYFVVYSVDKTNNRIEVAQLTDKTGTRLNATKFYIDVNDKTQYYDAKDTAAIKQLTLDGLSTDDVLMVYDCVDKDGVDQTTSAGSSELIFDILVKVEDL